MLHCTASRVPAQTPKGPTQHFAGALTPANSFHTAREPCPSSRRPGYFPVFTFFLKLVQRRHLLLPFPSHSGDSLCYNGGYREKESFLPEQRGPGFAALAREPDAPGAHRLWHFSGPAAVVKCFKRATLLFTLERGRLISLPTPSQSPYCQTQHVESGEPPGAAGVGRPGVEFLPRRSVSGA